MSVIVKRRTAPVESISAGCYDNSLQLSPRDGSLRGQVAIEGVGGGAWFHLGPAEARELAAVLLEWADGADQD